jgi:hypothetical protein
MTLCVLGVRIHVTVVQLHKGIPSIIVTSYKSYLVPPRLTQAALPTGPNSTSTQRVDVMSATSSTGRCGTAKVVASESAAARPSARATGAEMVRVCALRNGTFTSRYGLLLKLFCRADFSRLLLESLHFTERREKRASGNRWAA